MLIISNRIFGVRKRLRTALREILICGVLIALSLFLYDRASDSLRAGILACSLMGLALSPVLWGVYRLGRFVFIR